MSNSRTDDDDALTMRQARALLCAAQAAVVGGECVVVADQARQINAAFAAQALEHGTSVESCAAELSRLVGDLRYFIASAASGRWAAGVSAVLERAFDLSVVSIDDSTKQSIRLGCSVCGQPESRCASAVLLCGADAYAASAFLVADPVELWAVYAGYAACYNAILDSRRAATHAFLGCVLPGARCLKHLICAFNAQDVIRRAVDGRVGADGFDRGDVVALAARLDELRESARAGDGRLAALGERDEGLWGRVLAQQPRGRQLFESGHARFARLMDGDASDGDASDGDESPRRSKRRVLFDTASDDDLEVASAPVARRVTRSMSAAESVNVPMRPTRVAAPTSRAQLVPAALGQTTHAIADFRVAGLVHRRTVTLSSLSQAGRELIEAGRLEVAAAVFAALASLTRMVHARGAGLYVLGDCAGLRGVLDDVPAAGGEAVAEAVAEAVLLAVELEKQQQ